VDFQGRAYAATCIRADCIRPTFETEQMLPLSIADAPARRPSGARHLQRQALESRRHLHVLWHVRGSVGSAKRSSACTAWHCPGLYTLSCSRSRAICPAVYCRCGCPAGQVEQGTCSGKLWSRDATYAREWALVAARAHLCNCIYLPLPSFFARSPLK